MINEYQDMLAKAKFYKKQVLQSFVKQGYFPSDEEVQAALADIDTRSALLETYLSAKGSLFNTKEINYMFECIYKDLNILYEVLNTILIEQYNRLKLEVEARLVEIEQKAINLKRRMDEEVHSTSLGTTIFFKSNQWTPETNDDVTIIPLTTMNMINGSRIALFVNINNIEADSVYFKFESVDGSSESFFALPYNYNEDVYTIPGEYGVNTYDIDLNGKLVVNGNVEILLDNVDYNNEYKILGGKSYMKVTYKDDDTVVYESFATKDRPFQALRDCYIEFYMYDDTYISYNFNMAPNHTNFSLNDGSIVSDKSITKIFIDAPKDFVCSFNLEKGEIWSTSTDALIKDNNTILYTGDWYLRDFRILEYVKSEVTEYKISLILKSNESIVDYIDCVYIKEID